MTSISGFQTAEQSLSDNDATVANTNASASATAIVLERPTEEIIRDLITSLQDKSESGMLRWPCCCEIFLPSFF